MGVVSCGTTMLDQGVFQNIGAVTWDTTAKTASFTAVSGNGYFVNTTSGGITVTLPASPSAGDIISIADYTNTFDTNNVTIGRNSEPIGGVAQDATLSTQGQSVTFVYVDGTEGWKNVQDSTSNVIGTPPFIVATGGTVTCCGNCKVHTFTSPGTFSVTNISSSAPNNVLSYMVVAGGGGGAQDRGGGGGGGGFREDKSPVTPYTASPLDGAGSISATLTDFPITVGGGGTGGPSAIGGADGRGSPGSNSIFSTITSAGGGGGAPGCAGPTGPSARNALDGGSGGGGGSGNDAGGCGGTGNTPPVTPSQGNDGGNASPNTRAAGGGGATVAGAASPTGNGGDGATTSINFSSTTFAGGGGGGINCGTAGSGGSGGGGDGVSGANAGNAGTVNTGGGGGGGGSPNPASVGGNGGSGIVIIRYKYQ